MILIYLWIFINDINLNTNHFTFCIVFHYSKKRDLGSYVVTFPYVDPFIIFSSSKINTRDDTQIYKNKLICSVDFPNEYLNFNIYDGTQLPGNKKNRKKIVQIMKKNELFYGFLIYMKIITQYLN